MGEDSAGSDLTVIAKAAYHNGFPLPCPATSMQFDRPFDVIVVGAGHAGVV